MQDLLSPAIIPAGLISKVESLHGKRILDMTPRVTIEEGAYENESLRLADIEAKPTGAVFPRNYKSMSLRMLNRLITPTSLVVDIGCHNGEIIHHIASENKIGIDISLTSLFNKTPNILDSSGNDFIISDGKSLPINDGVVDAVLICDVLEHLLRPEELLAEAMRVLKPGGIAFISVPNLVHLGNRLSMLCGSGSGWELAQVFKGKSLVVPISGPRFPDQRLHLRWFTSSSLTGFLEGVGFRVESRFGIGPVVSRLKLEKWAASTALLTGVIARKPS